MIIWYEYILKVYLILILPFITHFHDVAKSTVLHCAFHLRRGGVLWPLFLFIIMYMVRKCLYGNDLNHLTLS